MMWSQSHFFPINLKTFRVTLMDDYNHSIYIARMIFSLITLPVTIRDVNVEAKGHYLLMARFLVASDNMVIKKKPFK